MATAEEFHFFSESRSALKVSPWSNDFSLPTWENAEADILRDDLTHNQCVKLSYSLKREVPLTGKHMACAHTYGCSTKEKNEKRK